MILCDSSREQFAILLGICALFFIMSCQRTVSQDFELNCSALHAIQDSDQHLRQTEFGSEFLKLLDSLAIDGGYANGMGDVDSENEPRFDEWWDMAKYLEKPLSRAEEKRIDSLWRIQWSIDSSNTLHVIELIETFGIDSLNAVDQSCNLNSLIVFVHSPDGLKECVRSIVEANKAGVGDARYRHILWHLDGRE